MVDVPSRAFFPSYYPRCPLFAGSVRLVVNRGHRAGAFCFQDLTTQALHASRAGRGKRDLRNAGLARAYGTAPGKLINDSRKLIKGRVSS